MHIERVFSPNTLDNRSNVNTINNHFVYSFDHIFWKILPWVRQMNWINFLLNDMIMFLVDYLIIRSMEWSGGMCWRNNWWCTTNSKWMIYNCYVLVSLLFLSLYVLYIQYVSITVIIITVWYLVDFFLITHHPPSLPHHSSLSCWVISLVESG